MKKKVLTGLFVLHAMACSTQTAANILKTAQSFLNIPYRAGTLEQPGQEQLVTNLEAMDCWTFVEQSLALAQAQASGRPWTGHLQSLRYRNGHIDGYGSRIHYFLEWVMQAESNGYLSDMTRSFGGVPYQKIVSYMSRFPEKYPQLAEKGALEAVLEAESRINSRSWFYIPASNIAAMEHRLTDGDIVATTAVHPLLDVTHQGFIVKKNGRAYLLHASSRAGKVVVSDRPLAEYVGGNADQSGILVLRLE
ncbi:MAG: DUF1460 domain-containing protein [Saprospiraceae bacterium]|nr:DUF1460 domain-containing protein [Saprospiraceae bacterium]